MLASRRDADDLAAGPLDAARALTPLGLPSSAAGATAADLRLPFFELEDSFAHCLPSMYISIAS